MRLNAILSITGYRSGRASSMPELPDFLKRAISATINVISIVGIKAAINVSDRVREEVSEKAATLTN